MVIDTSALLAILQDEPERRAFAEAIENAGSCSMSVGNLLETSLVIESRFGAEGTRDLDQLVEKARIELVPVDLEQLGIARRAFNRFGKGRHPASLNSGDCFAYALARALGEPLLYKGDDFARTDIGAAVPRPRRGRKG
jgi:ribonuclease VapC